MFTIDICTAYARMNYRMPVYVILRIFYAFVFFIEGMIVNLRPFVYRIYTVADKSCNCNSVNPGELFVTGL